MSNQYPFTLMPLPYTLGALSPYLTEPTLEIHYHKLHQGYVDKLNHTLKSYPAYQSWPLEKLIIHVKALPQEIRLPISRYAGGVYNHNLYWQGMSPCPTHLSPGAFSQALDYYFGSFGAFQQLFMDTAMSTFGSGWTWLVSEKGGRLKIVSTPNQDSPLAKLAIPLMVVDLWEHSYFLQYHEKRLDYLTNWWHLINWPWVDAYYGQYHCPSPF